jgi:hypothetical protein
LLHFIFIIHVFITTEVISMINVIRIIFDTVILSVILIPGSHSGQVFKVVESSITLTRLQSYLSNSFF